MTRYMMLARSQGKAFMQQTVAFLEREDVHRWIFVRNLTPEVECDVRKWLLQRLNGLYCDLQVMYTPHLRLHTHSATQARTHIVLTNTPLPHTMADGDEAVEVDARGLNARGTVKATIKATGLNPHLSVCGWPFCLGDLDDADAEEGCATGISCTPAPHRRKER